MLVPAVQACEDTGTCPGAPAEDSFSSYRHCAPSLADLPWQAGESRCRRMGGGDVWKVLGAVATRAAITLESEPSLPG